MQKNKLNTYILKEFSETFEILNKKDLEIMIESAEKITTNSDELLCYLILRLQEVSDYEFDFEDKYKERITFIEQTYAHSVRYISPHLDLIFVM